MTLKNRALPFLLLWKRKVLYSLIYPKFFFHNSSNLSRASDN